MEIRTGQTRMNHLEHWLWVEKGEGENPVLQVRKDFPLRQTGFSFWSPNPIEILINYAVLEQTKSEKVRVIFSGEGFFDDGILHEATIKKALSSESLSQLKQWHEQRLRSIYLPSGLEADPLGLAPLDSMPSEASEWFKVVKNEIRNTVKTRLQKDPNNASLCAWRDWLDSTDKAEAVIIVSLQSDVLESQNVKQLFDRGLIVTAVGGGYEERLKTFFLKERLQKAKILPKESRAKEAFAAWVTQLNTEEEDAQEVAKRLVSYIIGERIPVRDQSLNLKKVLAANVGSEEHETLLQHCLKVENTHLLKLLFEVKGVNKISPEDCSDNDRVGLLRKVLKLDSSQWLELAEGAGCFEATFLNKETTVDLIRCALSETDLQTVSSYSERQQELKKDFAETLTRKAEKGTQGYLMGVGLMLELQPLHTIEKDDFKQCAAYQNLWPLALRRKNDALLKRLTELNVPNTGKEKVYGKGTFETLLVLLKKQNEWDQCGWQQEHVEAMLRTELKENPQLDGCLDAAMAYWGEIFAPSQKVLNQKEIWKEFSNNPENTMKKIVAKIVKVEDNPNALGTHNIIPLLRLLKGMNERNVLQYETVVDYIDGVQSDQTAWNKKGLEGNSIWGLVSEKGHQMLLKNVLKIGLEQEDPENAWGGVGLNYMVVVSQIAPQMLRENKALCALIEQRLEKSQDPDQCYPELWNELGVWLEREKLSERIEQVSHEKKETSDPAPKRLRL